MRLRNLWQLFRGACCREKRDDHKAHDEGRSLIYDAKKCNAVSAQFFRNPNGTVLYGPIYVARLSWRRELTIRVLASWLWSTHPAKLHRFPAGKLGNLFSGSSAESAARRHR